MGLNYSFEFISKTENRLKLLEAFSKRLSKDCRDKFGSFDKYEPEYEDLITDSWEEIYIIKMGIKLFGNKGDYINNNSYCFSILPEIDDYVESIPVNEILLSNLNDLYVVFETSLFFLVGSIFSFKF